MLPSARRRGAGLCAGFTLSELVITLAVAAILTTLVIPAWRDYIVNTKLSTGTNTLVASLNFARSEAIMRAAPVSVCPSTNGIFCTGTPWNQGWIVFTDQGTAGIIDGNDEVISGHEGYGDDPELILAGPNYVQFQPNGGLVSECGVECLETPARPVSLLASVIGLIVQALPISEAVAAPPGGETPQGLTSPTDTQDGGGLGEPEGQLTDPGPPPSFAGFQVCRGGTGRSVSISPIGRVQVVEHNCAQP